MRWARECWHVEVLGAEKVQDVAEKQLVVPPGGGPWFAVESHLDLPRRTLG
jgi:hypothetical protein